MRVALVHDWLVSNRGGEHVLDAMCELYPSAEIFTLIHKKGSVSERIEGRPIHTSFLQSVPGIFERYRHFLPLFPAAIRTLRPRGFDLVLSSSHCVAKGIPVPEGARHVSYIHAPMRYMWELFDDYFGPGRASLPVRIAALAARPALQAWDTATAKSVHHFIANSQNIARKVALHYGREASVVHPPVELPAFEALPESGGGQGGYFLWVGAAAPYKRLDLVLEAFSRLKLPLWIAGPGKFPRGLPPRVRLLGEVPAAELPRLYWNARALLFPGDEDFGITPLESQAAGRPVIALARGGALETLTPRSALFFQEQSVMALVAALKQFPQWERTFDPREARAQAALFGRERFLRELNSQVLEGFGG